jgi:hypothetical protein
MSDQPTRSPDRFHKRSGRLILEEHGTGHEVPAGCGGLVLRWRNPHAAVPLVFRLYSPGEAKAFLDGTLVTQTGLDLAPGPHLLALELAGVKYSRGLFMFVAGHEPDHYHRHLPTGLDEKEWQVLSAPDGTWRATIREPVSAWTHRDFDEEGWVGLTDTRPAPTVNWNQPGALQAYWCNNFGAAFLALPSSTGGRGTVWVRKRLVVPGPEST